MKSTLPLWDHQSYGVKKILHHKKYALLFDMGTGKTRTTIETLNEIYKQKNKCVVLIVCPKSVVPVWPEEFNKYSEEEFKIITLDQSSVALKNKTLSTCYSYLHKTFVAVINYESMWRDPIGKKIKSIPWDCIIMDEAHRLNSPGSKVSWYAKDLKSEYKIVLTGTPMSTPLGIYGCYRFLDKTIFGSSFNAFKNQYAVEVNCGNFSKVVGYKNHDDLNSRIYSIAHRVMLKDVISLPEEMHIQRHCELSPKIRKVYEEFKEELVAEYNNGMITATNGLVKILRLAQIVGGYIHLQDAGQYIESPKVDVMMDIVNDLPIDEPIAIFFRFTSEIIKAKELIEKSGRTVAVMSRNVNQLQEWKDGKFNTICIQMQKGAEGVDLTRCRYCIYYSKGYNPLHYQQSLARVLRPGQTKNVIYYHILANNTIDTIIENVLSTKERDVMLVLSQL